MDISKEHSVVISISVKPRVNGLFPWRKADIKNLFQLFFPPPQEKWPNQLSLLKNTMFLPENCAFPLSVPYL